MTFGDPCLRSDDFLDRRQLYTVPLVLLPDPRLLLLGLHHVAPPPPPESASRPFLVLIGAYHGPGVRRFPHLGKWLTCPQRICVGHGTPSRQRLKVIDVVPHPPFGAGYTYLLPVCRRPTNPGEVNGSELRSCGTQKFLLDLLRRPPRHQRHTDVRNLLLAKVGKCV